MFWHARRGLLFWAEREARFRISWFAPVRPSSGAVRVLDVKEEGKKKQTSRTGFCREGREKNIYSVFNKRVEAD